MSNNLGRVQGGGFYASTSYSETNIPVSSVTVSDITPLVGDTIINANGAECRITAVSGSEYIVTKYGTFRPATSQDNDAVHFTPQTLTAEQQGQARANIDAQAAGDYATKDEINNPVTADIVCPHELEITGNTGDEHGLAISDQQMLITKIQGQTRRKSLNLAKFYGTSVTNNGVTYSYSNGIFTLNGTATNTADVYFDIADAKSVLSLGKTYTLALYDPPADIYIDNWSNGTHYYVSTEEPIINFFNIKEISGNFRFVQRPGSTYNNVKVKFAVYAGTYTASNLPPFESYDKTLVNSKCDFLSTGRNLANLTAAENFGDNHYVFGLGTLQPGTYYVKTNGGGNQYLYKDDKIFVNNIENGSTFTITEKSTISIDWYQYNSVSTVMLNYGSKALPYEPYKAENLHFDVPLGQWDYWQGNRIYRQTSQVISLNGSENWLGDPSWDKANTTCFDLLIAANNILNCENDSVFVSNNILESCSYNMTKTSDSNMVCMSQGGTGITIRIGKSIASDVNKFKSWLANNPIKLAYKLAAQTAEAFPFAGGYAVYNGGLQQQVTENIPYILYKRYSLNVAAQLLANVEIDREQQTQIDDQMINTRKVVYNLGEYDTYSEEDRSIKIKRVTGYYYAKKLDATSFLKDGKTKAYKVPNFPLPFINNDTIVKAISNKTKLTVSANLQYENNVLYSLGLHADGLVIVTDGIQDHIEEVTIQYELPEEQQFIESLFPNSPLGNLPQEGMQWVREEWEKGLNLFSSNIELGTFSQANGSPASDNSRLRTNDYIPLNAGTYTIDWSGPSNIVLYVYNKDKIFEPSLSAVEWIQDVNQYTFSIKNDCFVKFAFRKNDESDVTLADISNVMLNYGSHAYPFRVYNGEIIRKRDLPNFEKYVKKSGDIMTGSLGVDTINGSTLGNAMLRQMTNNGNIVVGSVLQHLRFVGSEIRPKYSDSDNFANEETYSELALLRDLDSYLPLGGGEIDGQLTVNGYLQIADNGNITDGARIQFGDDAYMKDVDVSNAVGLIGINNSNEGYIVFGTNCVSLGSDGTKIIAGAPIYELGHRVLSMPFNMRPSSESIKISDTWTASSNGYVYYRVRITAQGGFASLAAGGQVKDYYKGEEGYWGASEILLSAPVKSGDYVKLNIYNATILDSYYIPAG